MPQRLKPDTAGKVSRAGAMKTFIPLLPESEGFYMAEAAGTVESANRQPIPIDERVLTEVDHLNANRLPDGSFEDYVLDDLLLNLTTAVQEAAMPFAVSRTEHTLSIDPETQKRTFMWLGKTAVEAAMSGYDFHIHEVARSRVDVEVDEARHAETDLRPGVVKVFISPRISEADAPYEIAKQEHLGDDDSVRVSWIEREEGSRADKRILQSLLARDIPLTAWVAMLEDSDNIFGKSIKVANPESALGVMEVHRELEVPLEVLPKGPVSLIEAVLPYIADEKLAESVSYQLERYHDDQEDMRRKAESIAERWLSFEIDLAEGMKMGYANLEIRSFIFGLQGHWSNDDLEIIQQHQLSNTDIKMTRQLAVVLENAKRNMLWVPAAVITNNPDVLSQLDLGASDRIHSNEMLLQMAWQNGNQTVFLEAQNNKLVAGENVRVGGGCAGVNDSNFGSEQDRNNSTDERNNFSNAENKSNWKWKKGVCQVRSCFTRPGETEVGPCSVCRNCQTKFDKGEDPTKDVVDSIQTTAEAKQPALFEVKAREAAEAENKQLAREFDELVEREKTLTIVY